MKITDIVWLGDIVEKLWVKHHVSVNEVVEVLEAKPQFRFVEKGYREGEDVYAALGKTLAGRYLIIFFVYKNNEQALILSARNMTDKEKSTYGKK